MRNKLILFLMLALFGSTSFLRAQVSIDFETGDFSQFEFVNDETHPWVISDVSPTGNYCMMSSNAGIASSTSMIQATFVFPTDGTISFDAECMGEGTSTAWDKCIFKIDGTDQFSYGAHVSGWNPYSYEVTAGSHTFTWIYQKDSSVNPTGDYFKVDNINFVFAIGEVSVDPEAFVLGERPKNGWMEPFSAKIYNKATPTPMQASISNQSGSNPFTLSQEINTTLAGLDSICFDVLINPSAPAGSYTESFTLTYTNDDKDVIEVPVTGTLYTAGEADIVETAKALTLSETTNATHNPTGLHANYMLPGMTEMMPDAVYSFSITEDRFLEVTATGTNGRIAIYNAVDDFHPTAETAPAVSSNSLTLSKPLVSGSYYMIVAGTNLTSVEVGITDMPAPTELAYTAPEDGAHEVAAPVNLTWEGGDNASQYKVLFGTQYPPVDNGVWMNMDDNFGNYPVEVMDNTIYHWQVIAKNSKGTVTGPVWSFTTKLTRPTDVEASETEIFVDGSTLLKWKLSAPTGGGALPETQIGEGTTSSTYLPTYNLYNYSYTQQIFTGEEIGSAGTINSISFFASANANSDVRNLTMYMVNTDKTSFDSGTDWIAVTDDDIVFTGSVEFVANQWTTLTLAEPFDFDGSNLVIAVNDLTGSWTTSIQFYQFNATAQAIRIYQDSAPYSPSNPGSGTVMNTKNQIIINKEEAKGGREFLSFNVYDGDTQINTEPITEKQYLVSGLSYDMTGHNLAVTAVYAEGESPKSNPVVVKVSGYGTFEGTVTELISGEPLEGVTVTFTGSDEFNNSASFSGTTDADGHYTIEDVKCGTYIGKASLEGFENAYSESVDLAYEATETVDFVIHESYNPVFKVYAEEIDSTMSKVTWSMFNFDGPGGSSASPTVSYNFDDNTMMGWTNIDADGDGNVWVSSANPGIYHNAGVSLSGTGHNSSEAYVISGSYANATGQALHPDNYLVAPQKGVYTSVTFYACAQDASYAAEHFGVAVSTTGNTSAADFTTIWEQTMTAKGPRPTGDAKPVVRGAKQGSWYEFTVDFSDYAGQQIWVAIRHFNCTDMFILNVDDITLNGAGKDRSVEAYNVYRKAIAKENGITEADSIMLAEHYTDTLYADFDWFNCEPGLYQYGVAALYPSVPTGGGKSNRDEIVIGDGTSTTYNVPFNSLYGYSFVEQIYTAEEIGTGGMINSIAFEMQSTTSSTNEIEIFMKNVDIETFASTSDYIPVTAADKVYDGTFTFETGWNTIDLNTPFQYDGTSNLMIAMHEYTSGYSSRYFYYTSKPGSIVTFYSDSSNPDPYNIGSYTGTSYVREHRANITIDLIPGGGGGNNNPVTDIVWSNVLPKNMETVVTVNAVASTGSTEGATVTMTNVNEANFSYEAEIDSTGAVVFDSFRKGDYKLTVSLDGFESEFNETEISIWADTTITAHFTEVFAPVDNLVVSGTGFARWTNMLPEASEVAERYIVNMNNTLQGETTNNFMQLDTEGLTVGETYEAKVAVIYTTGMSPWKTANFTFIGCDAVTTQVDTMWYDPIPDGSMDIVLHWNDGGGTPTPPTPPTPPTGGTTYSFEGTMEGWTTIDADGDNHNWQLGSVLMAGYLIPSHDGADCVSSQSYDGQTSTALHPDNYLVSPAKAAYTGMSFWACAQDASYAAEHFGVAVSTTGNTSAADFTTIAEWTMTAKDGGMVGNYASRSREGKEGTWYQYPVDLSAYAGQEIWVAIRHFNCTDMFYLDVDEVTLATDSKLDGVLGNAGVGFGYANNNFTDDGNWYYYDNGSNADAIGLTSGGGFYWGILLPAGTYEGNSLTKVAYFDYAAHSGQIMIYQGGTSAPETLLYTQNYNVTGTETYIDIDMTEPVELDESQSVWVVMHNTTGQYVAAIDAGPGVANGSCISTDGNTWYNTISAASSGQLDGNWNLRAYIEAGGGGAAGAATYVPGKFNILVDGEVVGATSENTFTVTASDYAEHLYEVVYVDANYNISCPMGLLIQVPLTSVISNEVVSSIYPNPTNGDLHIEASDMVSVSVLNTLGQMLFNQAVKGDEIILDMARYEAGVYMINVTTKNGSCVKRVVVTK